MAYSKPSQILGELRTNGTLFANLYMRRVIDDVSNDAADQYFWMQTDASGLLLPDKRLNAMNGYFSESQTALLNIPSGYGNTTPVNTFLTTKYVGYHRMFPFDNNLPETDLLSSVRQTKSEYDEAIAAGADYIAITIAWDVVFWTLAQQNANADSSWAKYDNLINHVKGKLKPDGTPVKLVLRIFAVLDDNERYDIYLGPNAPGSNTRGFYGVSKSAMDEFNRPAFLGRGEGHVSLAYSSGVSQVIDFVQKCTQRYSNSFGDRLLWVAVGLTGQHEAGYNYENKYYTDDNYASSELQPRLFDYSTYSVEGFRTAMAAKYVTPTALNANWGSNYNQFSEIQPPSLGWQSPNHADYDQLLRSNKGFDWYKYNYGLVRAFQINCENTIKTIAPSVGFVLEFGSVGGRRSVDVRRMAIDMSDMGSYSDMMKAELGSLSYDPTIAMSMDIARVYPNKIGMELNTADFVQIHHITNAETIRNMIVEMGTAAIRGALCRDIMIISTKADSYFNSAIQALSALKTEMNSFTAATVTTVATLNYNLTQIIQNNQAVISAWQAAGGGINSRVKLIQDGINNGGGGGGVVVVPPNCANAVSVYSLQQYCLSSTSIKSSVYDSGTNDLRNDYHINKLKFVGGSHAITYRDSGYNGDLAKCNWRIVGDSDGVTYVKNTQLNGYLNNYNDGTTLSNNQPNRQLNTSLVEDSIFYLPNNQKYRIFVQNNSTLSVRVRIFTYDIYQVFADQALTSAQGEVSFLIDVPSLGRNFMKDLAILTNAEFETTSDFVVRSFQTVREGGIKFRFQGLNKTNGAVISWLSYNFQNLEPSVPIVVNGDYFVGQNNAGGITRANVTLTNGSVNKSREFWSTTGNHDGHSITCDDNQNLLTSSNYNVAVGSEITLTWGGSFASGQVLYFYGDANSFTELSRTDKTITIRVNQFPFWIQAQPSAVASNNFCHGWTGIYFC